MNQLFSVMAVVFLLIFQGAPSKAALSVGIDSPASGTLSGIAEFEVHFDNPDEKNMTISLYVSSSDEDLYELADQVETDKKKGSVKLRLDTNNLNNGKYKIKAVGDTDDQNAESKAAMYQVYNPKAPLITWTAPKGNTVLKGAYQFKVNITGDHGGLAGTPKFYYKLESGSKWTFFGPGSTVAGTTLWSLSFDTMLLNDSSYYFMANATSIHDMYAESVLGPVKVDNEHAPVVKILSPVDGSVISGKVTLQASASDLDENLHPDGVVFYHSRIGSEIMTRIGNDPEPQSGLYSLSYDSEKLANGKYKIWAYVRDTGTPSTSAWSGSNSTIRNPLVVRSVVSIGRESDRWDVEVRIAEGPKAYPLSIEIAIDQGSGFTEVGESKLVSEPIVSGVIKVRVPIPLRSLVEGNVTARAIVKDVEGAKGELVVKDLFQYRSMIHPVVRVLPPEGILAGNASVEAEVLDDDNPLKGPVTFWFSTDNKTWKLIGVGSFLRARTYGVVWDTLHVENFTDYHIKANHSDSDGLPGEGFRGGFEVRNEHPAPPPPPPKEKAWYESQNGITTAIGIMALIAAILGVAFALLMGAVKRDARRKEKLKKIEAEKERRKGIDGRAKARDRELTHMLTVGSRFIEPVRRTSPRGSVPLKPAEMGIRKQEKPETPRPKPQLQEFEHPPM